MEPIAAPRNPSYFDQPQNVPTYELLDHTKKAYTYLQSLTGWQTAPDLYNKITEASFIWLQTQKSNSCRGDVIKKRCLKINALAEKLVSPAVATIVLKNESPLIELKEFPVCGPLWRLLMCKSKMVQRMMANAMVESKLKKLDFSETNITASIFGMIFELLSNLHQVPSLTDWESGEFPIEIPDEQIFPLYEAIEYLEIEVLAEIAFGKLAYLISHMNPEQLCEIYNLFNEKMTAKSSLIKEFVLLALSDCLLNLENVIDTQLKLGEAKLVEHPLYLACKMRLQSDIHVYTKGLPQVVVHYLDYCYFSRHEKKEESIKALSQAFKEPQHRLSPSLLKAALDFQCKYQDTLTTREYIMLPDRTLFQIDPNNIEYRKKHLDYLLRNYQTDSDLYYLIIKHCDHILRQCPQDHAVAWTGVRVCLARCEKRPELKEKLDPCAIHYLALALAKADPSDPTILDDLGTFIANIENWKYTRNQPLVRMILKVAEKQPRLTQIFPQYIKIFSS